MKQQDDIYNELNEITPSLAQLERINVFAVPENYFLALPITILEKINPEKSTSLPATNTPFSVPAGYFENLAANVLLKIHHGDSDYLEELETLSPTLYSLRHPNVFSVPSGYFEALTGKLVSAVRPQAKVVTMKTRSMVWNCIAAAMITGFMAISALWTTNNNDTETFVTANNITAPLIKDALQYKNDQQINDGIATLSDSEIIKYLEATGNNADEEALAAGIPEKELPDEQDYLKNDNTLQLFLGKTNRGNNQN